jgi:hypothetical protein
MAKKPEDRFQSAADFASAMQAVLAGQRELPPSLTLPPAPAPNPPTSTPLPVDPASIPKSGPPVGLIVGIGLAFLVGVVLTVLFMKL